MSDWSPTCASAVPIHQRSGKSKVWTPGDSPPSGRPQDHGPEKNEARAVSPWHRPRRRSHTAPIWSGFKPLSTKRIQDHPQPKGNATSAARRHWDRLTDNPLFSKTQKTFGLLQSPVPAPAARPHSGHLAASFLRNRRGFPEKRTSQNKSLKINEQSQRKSRWEPSGGVDFRPVRIIFFQSRAKIILSFAPEIIKSVFNS